MKLASLAPPASAAPVQMSSRGGSDGDQRSDFGSVLGDMAPEPSAAPANAANAGTAAVAVQAGAQGADDLLTLVTRAASRGGSASSASSQAAGQGDAGSSENSSGRIQRRRSGSGDDDTSGSTDAIAAAAAPAAAIGQVAVVSPLVITAAASQAAFSDAGTPKPGGSASGPAASSLDAAPAELDTGSSVESAIVSGTVRFESHLGFGGDRMVPPGAMATNTGSVTKRASNAVASSAAPAASADGADLREPPLADPAASSTSLDATTPADRGATDVPASAHVVADTASATATISGAEAMPIPSAPTVVQQAADIVATLAASSVPDQDRQGPQVAPARTMALQLAPAGLGTLTVRLHVVGRSLDVHLDASDERTAALIDRDRGVLSDALRGENYQLHSLSVTTHDATMTGGPHADRGADAPSADSRTPDRSRDGGAGGGNNRGARDQPGRDRVPPSRPADGTSLVRGGAALFV